MVACQIKYHGCEINLISEEPVKVREFLKYKELEELPKHASDLAYFMSDVLPHLIYDDSLTRKFTEILYNKVILDFLPFEVVKVTIYMKDDSFEDIHAGKCKATGFYKLQGHPVEVINSVYKVIQNLPTPSR